MRTRRNVAVSGRGPDRLEIGTETEADRVHASWPGRWQVGMLLAAVLWLPLSAEAAPTANNQSIGTVGPGKEKLFSFTYSGSPTS